MSMKLPSQSGGGVQAGKFTAKSLPRATTVKIFDLDEPIEEGYIMCLSTNAQTNALGCCFKITNNVPSYVYGTDGSSYWSCSINNNAIYIYQTDSGYSYTYYCTLTITK